VSSRSPSPKATANCSSRRPGSHRRGMRGQRPRRSNATTKPRRSRTPGPLSSLSERNPTRRLTPSRRPRGKGGTAGRVRGAYRMAGERLLWRLRDNHANIRSCRGARQSSRFGIARRCRATASRGRGRAAAATGCPQPFRRTSDTRRSKPERPQAIEIGTGTTRAGDTEASDCKSVLRHRDRRHAPGR
jgi:hypothetical protein